jgi:hypothetical protein
MMDNNKQSKISSNTFYLSWHISAQKIAKEMSKDKAFDFLNAINEYAFFGTEPSLEFPMDMLFESIKPNIDKSIMRKTVGQKGGEGNKEEESTQTDEPKPTQANDKQTDSKDEAKLKQTSSKTEANDEQTSSYEYEEEYEDVDAYAEGEAHTSACEKNKPKQFGNDPPMQKHHYPKIDWQIFYDELIAAGFPDPGDVYRLNVQGRDLLACVDGLTWEQILAAVKNYGQVKALPNTWWNSNPNILTWAKKHIERFLPGNFNLEEYSGDAKKEESEEAYREQMRKKYSEGGTG